MDVSKCFPVGHVMVTGRRFERVVAGNCGHRGDGGETGPTGKHFLLSGMFSRRRSGLKHGGAFRNVSPSAPRVFPLSQLAGETSLGMFPRRAHRLDVGTFFRGRNGETFCVTGTGKQSRMFPRRSGADGETFFDDPANGETFSPRPRDGSLHVETFLPHTTRGNVPKRFHG